MTDSTNVPDSPVAQPLAAPPRSRGSAAGERSAPLTLAGIFFVVAGLGSLATASAYLIPVTAADTASSMSNFATRLLVVVVGGLAFMIGALGGYIVLARAGFPHRSRAMRAVTIGIALSWVLPPLAVFALALAGAPTPAAVQYVGVAVGAVLLLILAIAAARNRLLPTGFRVVPAVQLLLVVVGSIGQYWVALPLSGLSFLVAGTAFIVLAAHARASLEAASAG